MQSCENIIDVFVGVVVLVGVVRIVVVVVVVIVAAVVVVVAVVNPQNVCVLCRERPVDRQLPRGQRYHHLTEMRMSERMFCSNKKDIM